MVLTFFMYVLPILLKQSLIEVYSFKGLIMLAVLFAVMAATTISIQIFRNSIDDGSEILVLSKPITRTKMLWTKVFVLLIWILTISIVTGTISIFTIFTNVNNDNFSAESIIFGSYIGTLVIFVVWSSIAVFFSIFFKKFTIFLISMGIQSILIVISIVFSVLINPVAQNLNKENKINFENVTLLSIENNNVKYQNGLVGTYKNQVINENTRIAGETFKERNIKSNEILKSIWEQANKKSNKKMLQILDLEYQFATLLSIYDSKMLNNISLGSSYNGKTLMYEMFHNQLPAIALNLEFSNRGFDSVKKALNLTDISLLNTNWSLTSHGFTNFQHIEQKTNNFFSDNKFKYLSGKISFDDKYQLQFPIFALKNNLIQQKDFSDLKSFAQYYFVDSLPSIDSVLSKLKPLQNKLENLNKSTIYFSLIATQTKQLNKNVSWTKIGQDITKFQWTTYKTLIDYLKHPNNYSNFTEESVNTILEILGYDQTNPINFKNTVNVFITSNIDGTNSEQNLNQWYTYQPEIQLINNDDLQSFVVAKLANNYDMNALITVWILFAFIVFVISISLYSKQDFS